MREAGRVPLTRMRQHGKEETGERPAGLRKGANRLPGRGVGPGGGE